MSLLQELTESLRTVRAKIQAPPDQYRFRDTEGHFTVVRNNERVMVGYPGGPERDLREAFKKRVQASVFPVGDGLGDICYCDADQGFYMWTGTDWYLFGHRR